MTPSAQDWAELVRLPAVISVPGDALVGLAAAGGAAQARAALLPLASVSMYWAGMALNDWADRELDATERPERPVPSGRVSPAQALAAAGALTAASVGIAGLAAGRRGAGVATVLGVAVWTYDLLGKPTRFAPLSMALTRTLDVVLGATGGAATTRGRGSGWAVLPALAAGLHTLAVTDLSRGEVHGAAGADAGRATATTLLAAGAVVPVLLGRLARTSGPAASRRSVVAGTVGSALTTAALVMHTGPLVSAQRVAGRTGTGPDARHATVTGIRAFLPLQSALLAALGRPGQAVALTGLGTGAARLLRGGSPT